MNTKKTVLTVCLAVLAFCLLCAVGVFYVSDRADCVLWIECMAGFTAFMLVLVGPDLIARSRKVSLSTEVHCSEGWELVITLLMTPSRYMEALTKQPAENLSNTLPAGQHSNTTANDEHAKGSGQR